MEVSADYFFDRGRRVAAFGERERDSLEPPRMVERRDEDGTFLSFGRDTETAATGENFFPGLHVLRRFFDGRDAQIASYTGVVGAANVLGVLDVTHHQLFRWRARPTA